MLRLIGIRKDYPVADGVVQALKGIDIDFRESEFVAILGQSGCGKTTLLNIVGGLDGYTDGDLVIDGRSTKNYKDSDWDSYRNHSIGFVFQSYNLISHQSVLSNVEMALKISGVPSHERRARAKHVLELVGLGDQLDKKPTMMSGGQMQRVAIARALVNDPSIILADEPTGALDSATSVQIMDLLAEVAKDRLVIMVTHNPELAEKYASRIINLRDGVILSDTNPPTPDEIANEKPSTKPSKAKLGFLTALGLSLSNLLTKKGRTFLTAFAGAIGIIGIALIMSLSTGMNNYINKLESDTMGSYPIELQKTTIDMSSIMQSLMDIKTEENESRLSSSEAEIAAHSVVVPTVKETSSMIKENDLGKFKKYLDSRWSDIESSVAAVEYSYDIVPQVYRMEKDKPLQVSPSSIFSNTNMSSYMDAMSSSSMGMGTSSSSSISASTSSAWYCIPSDEGLRNRSYELKAGRYPQSDAEAVIIVDKYNQVSDYLLYTIGMLDIQEMYDMINAINDGKDATPNQSTFKYTDILGRHYTVLAQCDLYNKNEKDGKSVWYDATDDDEFVSTQMRERGIDVEIVGVLKLTNDSNQQSGIGYSSMLTDTLMKRAADSDIVKQQLMEPKINVLTGEEFESEKADEDKKDSAQSNKTDLISSLVKQTAYTVPAAENTEPQPEPEPEPPVETTYKIKFVNYDGTVLSESKEYKPGDKIDNIPEQSPSRAEDDKNIYVFLGWQSQATNYLYSADQIPPATCDDTYRAFYYAYVKPTDPQPEPTPTPTPTPQMPDFSTMTPEQIASMFGIDINKMAQDEIAKMMGADMSQMTPEELAKIYGMDMSNMDAASLAAMYGFDPSSMSEEELMKLYGIDPETIKASMMGSFSEEQIKALMSSMGSGSPKTYETVLAKLGYSTKDQPSAISLYPTDFEGKDKLVALLNDYNAQAKNEADKVTYTDYIGMLTSSITSMIDVISAILIAFTAISLVVSSIMIAIITWISVLERTKEIGILRAIGASKSDISKIFNAETFIEGFISGLIGVAATLLLGIPINIVVENMFQVSNISTLPLSNAALLIVLSIVLTFIAGFIPARKAAKKDPVKALRSE